MSLHLYFGPLSEVCQTGKEPNSLSSTDLIISVFQLILESEHKTKTVRENARWSVFPYLPANKKTPKPNRGEIARYTVLGSLYFHQHCSADGEKKYVNGVFSLIVQIFLMTEQWILNAIFSCNLLLVWTLYLSGADHVAWSHSDCTASWRTQF